MEIAPGVKMHFVSNQPYPLKDTLRLAQPSTQRAAFPASPNTCVKFKTDAPKRLLEDVPFHLVIAASERDDLKQSSTLFKEPDTYFCPFWASEHLRLWRLSCLAALHPLPPAANGRPQPPGQHLHPWGWFTATHLPPAACNPTARGVKMPPRWAALLPQCQLGMVHESQPGGGAKMRCKRQN